MQPPLFPRLGGATSSRAPSTGKLKGCERQAEEWFAQRLRRSQREQEGGEREGLFSSEDLRLTGGGRMGDGGNVVGEWAPARMEFEKNLEHVVSHTLSA